MNWWLDIEKSSFCSCFVWQSTSSILQTSSECHQWNNRMWKWAYMPINEGEKNANTKWSLKWSQKLTESSQVMCRVCKRVSHHQIVPFYLMSMYYHCQEHLDVWLSLKWYPVWQPILSLSNNMWLLWNRNRENHEKKKTINKCQFLFVHTISMKTKALILLITD